MTLGVMFKYLQWRSIIILDNGMAVSRYNAAIAGRIQGVQVCFQFGLLRLDLYIPHVLYRNFTWWCFGTAHVGGDLRHRFRGNFNRFREATVGQGKVHVLL